MLTPFTLTPLTPTLFLHQIELGTYAHWLAQGHDPTFFFQNLTDQMARQGQRVVHVWSDVVKQKPIIVASRLAALRGESIRVPGRLTQVRRIDKATAMAFLAEHHLQVPLPGKVRYGLFLPERYYRVLPTPPPAPPLNEGEGARLPLSTEGSTGMLPSPSLRGGAGGGGNNELLLAVATFAQPRQMKQDTQPYRSAELLRFANRVGFTVVGGLDKLLTTYLRNHPADDLMTYADRDWSDGASYRKVGFEAISDTPPQRFWVRPDELIRYSDTTLPTGVEVTNAHLLGYLPVFNAGSRKFVRRVV
ncbi:hypothetical protein FAES_1047 [Fibrella aestuarina BUZ 2]|uniref:Uncharacterized protein n=1 Tax=Fibrella aestuarina BUZ 2 TaxID=1166018 RepID=I0K4K4_9BACT|nr:hypothetical protein [Fibrella aestuarina]CCG99057.1 hypothetical protein FAES_1047 [Fibrella aestuarina BUZ 2]